MGRSPCCDKVGLKKGPWTPEEDQKLLAYIQEHGHGSWRALPPKAGLQRCGKSCRLRWTNYLRPDIKRGKFSLQEEQTIIQLHALLGNRWSAIASHLPKRTDNEIKNYWNTHLKKRLAKMGIDPTTHKPKNHALGSGQPKDIANLSHMAQWESARLEAEARIVRESKLVSSSYHSQLLTKAAAAAGLPPPPPQRPPCLDILKVWQGAWMSKPRKDISSTPTAAGFFSCTGTLESPTSIFNFSDNNAMNVPHVGSIHETPFPADGLNYVGNPSVACTQDQQVKGMVENSTVTTTTTTQPLHDIAEANSSSAYVGDGLRFPSFLEGYTDLSTSSIACSTAGPTDQSFVFEDSKISYWTNILNNSMMDSSVF